MNLIATTVKNQSSLGGIFYEYEVGDLDVVVICPKK